MDRTPVITVSSGRILSGQAFVQGWANVSSSLVPFGDTIILLQFSSNSGANITLATNTGKTRVPFSFSMEARGCYEFEIYAEDSLGNWGTFFFGMPCAITFEPSPQTREVVLLGAHLAINSTYTNYTPLALTTMVVANFLNSQGAVIDSPTAMITFSPYGDASGYEILTGIPHGTYNVTLNLYSTSYVTLSPTIIISVTV